VRAVSAPITSARGWTRALLPRRLAPLNRPTSLYLDLVRFLAAVVVLLTHLAYARFSGGMLTPLRAYGNDAVMVFFVLSGYVIAHTAATRDRELPTFALNRCARLFSVALPAIVITIVLDRIGLATKPELYTPAVFQESEPLVRVLTAATFTNELWFWSVRLFSNGPYWSLGYEFWYYALFAAAWYLRGARRAVVLILVAALIGPKILLLLPVWLLGLVVHRVNTTNPVGPRLGAVLWLGSIAAYAAFRGIDGPGHLLAWSTRQFGETYGTLRWSNEYLSSFVIGPLVALNFVGFHGCSAWFARALEPVAPLIRDWAGYTFSIYLFHLPLLQCLAASLPFDPKSRVSVVLLFASTLLGCRLFGLASEKQKDRAREWLRALAFFVANFARRVRGREVRA
jgi:peptidoglycan/LPS O-acetylase OafA/YrhL